MNSRSVESEHMALTTKQILMCVQTLLKDLGRERLILYAM